ncbi:lipase secretion chaperone [Aquabacterium sp.]|uniref:lipase secretion chaperone n=1 Tax=Aquabacterium sp. TaxID=1872578 RepID=UPI0019B5EB96|nr:lipase secretion chaperone [Aquabacterium sp.]MBC7698851.1 hypothetical protein [Aquabacterium sp.]
MIGKKWWLASALAAVAVAAGGWAWTHDKTAGVAASNHSGPAPITWATPTPHEAMATAASPLASGAASTPNLPAGRNPLDSMIPPRFRADRHGELAMDPTTRVDVERVHALYPRDEALQKLDAFSEGLPAQARRELKDLFQQYAQYAQAVTQTYPPELTIGSLDEAARQLAGLHALRQQYFGAERAEALYGEEEETSRKLLTLMGKQSDPNLSLEEKAALAQETLKKSSP